MSRRWGAALLVGGVLLASPAMGGDKNVPKDTLKESARTGGHAVRDGALTVGRTVRDFFKGGPKAAKRTWKANAEQTREHAREGGRRTRTAAHEE